MDTESELKKRRQQIKCDEENLSGKEVIDRFV